jgi:hypothetical protein
MKRLVISLIAVVMVALASLGGVQAEDPNWCEEGWALSSTSTLPIPGSGCSYVEREYYCEPTGRTQNCHQLVCGGGGGTEESCEDAQ